MKISLVVPCYNEEEVIKLFYKEVSKVEKTMSKVSFEIIFVNDGSVDHTLDLMRELSSNKNVRYISFSRNFGKESAMYAGLKEATGDYVAIMDADLQDPPSLLKEMYEILQTGDYDSVATRRVSRKGEPVIRSFFARTYYKIINKISKTEIV
ncbi:MAG: glycosyltransferase family 2 protein, partial [Bacilli bacterium]